MTATIFLCDSHAVKKGNTASMSRGLPQAIQQIIRDLI